MTYLAFFFRRKTDPITAGGKGDKKSEKPQQQQKRISLTRPPLRDAPVSPKRKRSEAPAEKADVMAVSSSPEEKPLQHSRAGRAIKVNRSTYLIQDLYTFLIEY